MRKAAKIAVFMLMIALWGYGAMADQPMRNLPAPPQEIALCGEAVPMDDLSIAEALDREFTIDVNDQAQVVMWLKRGARYFPYITRQLKEAGMPEDLKYLAVAESALLRGVRSPAGAVGAWQFMPFTARRYGLRVDRWIDERRNFGKSTAAALAYLRWLHDEFGSWTLAMAAYNCGEARVRKAIEEQGRRDYYELHLPRETMRYIFRIISAKIIMQNPKQYGYDLPPERLYGPVPAEPAAVYLSRTTDLLAIANAAGTTVRRIKELNPQFNRYALPKGNYIIMTPLGMAKALEAKVGHLPASKQYPPPPNGNYVVKRGDTLTGIAKRSGVSIAALRSANKIKGNKIFIGQRLVIPAGR